MVAGGGEREGGSNLPSMNTPLPLNGIKLGLLNTVYGFLFLKRLTTDIYRRKTYSFNLKSYSRVFRPLSNRK